MSNQPIYLDYNATTPHASEVIEAMRPYLEEHFGNPSSSHWYGRKTREAVETARSQVAALLNCTPAEVLFTSGGTESNNHAIRGIALARRAHGKHIITSQIEHPAVTGVCERLKLDGFEITYLPVDGHGMVKARDVEMAIRPETIFITLMHANNEVGTIQPIEEVAELAKSRGVVFHTDAAQSAGKIPTDVRALGVDLLSIAGHKLYAPKGVGALYIRKGTALERFMEGAGQEGGRRPGTENVLEVVGLGKACEVALRDLAANGEHMRRMRDRLEAGLLERVAYLSVNGHPYNRLPNTLSASVEGLMQALYSPPSRIRWPLLRVQHAIPVAFMSRTCSRPCASPRNGREEHSGFPRDARPAGRISTRPWPSSRTRPSVFGPDAHRDGERNMTSTTLVLGGGIGGMVAANEMRRQLPSTHRVVLVEKNAQHAFAPSFLWLMTGDREPHQIRRPLKGLLRRGVDLVQAEVLGIDPVQRKVRPAPRRSRMIT